MVVDEIYALMENQKAGIISIFFETYLQGFKETSGYYEFPPYSGVTEFETDDFGVMLEFLLSHDGKYFRFYFTPLIRDEIINGMLFLNKDGSFILGISVDNALSDIYIEKLKHDFSPVALLICNDVPPPDNALDFKVLSGQVQ